MGIMEIKSQCKDDLESGGEYINTAAPADVGCTTHLRTVLLRLLRWELTALQEIRHKMHAEKAGPCQKAP